MTKNSLLLLATGNADTLPSASAIRNDICLLQKAANGKKLGLTEGFDLKNLGRMHR